MSNTSISFDSINNALLQVDATAETSEAHGTLCGMICIQGKGDANHWISHITDEDISNNIETQESHSILLALHDKTLADIIGQNYELSLLMHDDDEALDIRVEDLCLWCQGFLYGLSIAGLNDISALPKEGTEILQDMSDISKAGYDPEADDNENEMAFAEITEYIRIGVYFIFSIFNDDGANSNANTIH